LRSLLHCPHDLFPAAIIKGDTEIEFGIGRRARLGPIDQFADIIRQPPPRAENAHANTFIRQTVQIPLHIGLQQPEQSVHFRYRAPPVLGREGIDREVLEADFLRCFDRSAQRLDAALMTDSSRQVSRLRPASIAIHNNGNVLRETAGWRPTLPGLGS